MIRSILPSLLICGLALQLSACGGDSDEPSTDPGNTEVTQSDTGTPDLSTSDLGTPDLGTPDLGTPDQGTPDTGPVEPQSAPCSEVIACFDQCESIHVSCLEDCDQAANRRPIPPPRANTDASASDGGSANDVGVATDTGEPVDPALCIQACVSADQACEQTCNFLPNFHLMLNYYLCILAECCDSNDPAACEAVPEETLEACRIESTYAEDGACRSEAEVCLAGNHSCSDVLICLQGCDNQSEEEEDACSSVCVQNGSLNAQTQLFTLLNCMTETCAELCAAPENADACGTCIGTTYMDALNGAGACGTEGAVCTGLIP